MADVEFKEHRGRNDKMGDVKRERETDKAIKYRFSIDVFINHDRNLLPDCLSP